MNRPDGPNADLVNLTPHPVRIVWADGGELVLPVGGPAARLKVSLVEIGHLHVGAEAVRVTYAPTAGAVVDLPDPVPGRWLVVSRLVADACRARHDLLFPDELVRDGDGHVVGCRALSSLVPDPLGARAAPRKADSATDQRPEEEP